MVNVPKSHHSILWEVCILTYSLIVLIFVSDAYVDHRWKLLLFIQIHVGHWWRVSGNCSTQYIGKPIFTSAVRCKESVSSNMNWVICMFKRQVLGIFPWRTQQSPMGRSRSIKALMTEVAGPLIIEGILNPFLHSQPWQ